MTKIKMIEQHAFFRRFASHFFQWMLNISLFMTGLILAYSLFNEAYSLYQAIINHSEKFQIVETIVIFFLYFEFLALIVQYFKYHYHFPLRYFLYIGITAMVRLIIVDHSNAIHTLFFALAILIMVIALFIVHTDRLRKS